MRSPLPYVALVGLAAGGAALSGAGWWMAATKATTERDAQAGMAAGRVLAAARQARDTLPRALDPADRLLGQVQARQTALSRGDRREAEQLEQTLANSVRRGQDGIRIAAAVDASGSVTWISQPGGLPSSLANQDFFIAHRYGRVATTVARSPGANGPAQPQLIVSRPLLGRDGGFGGIAIVVLEAGRLAQHLPPAMGPNEPVLALYHSDGTLLARGRGLGAQAMPAQLDPRLLPESGGDRSLMARDPRDRHAIATAAAQVAGHELVVAATLDDTQGATSAQGAAYAGYGLAGAFTLLWLAGTGWTGWRIRRRMRDVAAAEYEPEDVAPLPSRRPDGRRRVVPAAKPDVVETLPIGAYAARVSHDGTVRITAVSQAMERLTGWPPAAFSDQDRWQRCIDWSSYPPGEPLPERLLQEPEAEVRYRLRRPDGRWIWVHEICRVVADDANGVDVLGCLLDATREHELTRQAERAARADTQGMVAAGLAHDLKQPLQVISFAAQNGLEALASGPDGIEEARKRLQRVADQSERAAQIALQLSAFTRLDAVKLEPVSVTGAIRTVMAEVGQPLQEAGVEVQLNMGTALPPVRGLPVMVEQVLVNLCMNARDAMMSQPEGQRRLRIAAVHRPEQNHVEISVADSGGGVPAEHLERIFEMHFTTKEKGKGTGLGLTLCRFLMARFGGTISMRNIPGGAEARLRFPVIQLKPASQPAQPVVGEAKAPEGAARRNARTKEG